MAKYQIIRENDSKACSSPSRDKKGIDMLTRCLNTISVNNNMGLKFKVVTVKD